MPINALSNSHSTGNEKVHELREAPPKKLDSDETLEEAIEM